MSQNIERVEVNGVIYADNNDVESVTIYNTSSNKGTITNSKGEFIIKVALNDIVEISALQFKAVTVNIDKEVITSNVLKVYLTEYVNKLDEVIVGKVLTGNLLSDIENVEGEPPINFFDVGIPGYTGKPATQSERRLSEAGEFKPKMLLGLLGGGIPLNPILNGISGRTKELKQRVKLEANDNLLQKIKARLSEDFFSTYKLEKNKHTDFFYFCEEDENFSKRCKNKSDIEILEFLKEKLIIYKRNQEITED